MIGRCRAGAAFAVLGVVLLAGLFLHPASAGALAPATSPAIPFGRFTVTPASGPPGTRVSLASATPCPGGAGTVAIQMVQIPATSDAIPVYGPLFFPVAVDGSWTASFPSAFPESGPVQIDASCSGASGATIYADQTFRQTPEGAGYWLATVAEVGVPCFCPPPGPPTNVLGFGDARFVGSPAQFSTTIPLVGMAVTQVEGLGYWMAAADGGVFAFGDAVFRGSTGGIPLDQPVVGMAATPTGGGYWLVAGDGGVFAFGDADFHGSTGGIPLDQPVVGMAATPTGDGYRLVAADGGIFAFGDADFHGSTGGVPLDAPVTGMAASASVEGYWLVASDGGVFSFGAAPFLGSCGGCRTVRNGQPRFMAIAASPAT